MENIPEDRILKFHRNTLEDVRKTYGYESSADMKNAVDILDEWMKTQNHFVKKDFSREYLERTIITTKGSVERAKSRLDKFAEYLRAHDYANGYIFVMDYTELSLMDFLPKMNPVDLRQALTVLMEGYGVRIKGIHLITQSKFIDGVVAVFKQVLSTKVGERIQVHKDMDSLHKFVPKEILPREYGGEDKSLRELHDAWVEVLSSESHTMYQKMMNAAKTDESLRQTDKFNDQYMGMPGTFRTLSVD
ncbi:alpha-tocopherol transfer protein-like isoform X2 [Pectinophora gossypiella]|uniref:alpha-tocopherol transfer protein-like isoform X2 n=1 Tax=Pectinophora gossypiella TaxID=13191 RepID=UPI00214E1B0A|nr:alpha-tocopherol transfer protein-like isoform X2 [Pectinophora gossypiella]